MTNTEHKLGRLMSRGQIAAELGVSERTLRRHLASMVGLTCYQIGRQIRFDEYDVAAIRERLRIPCPTVVGSAPVVRETASVVTFRTGSNSQEAERDLLRRLSEKSGP